VGYVLRVGDIRNIHIILIVKTGPLPPGDNPIAVNNNNNNNYYYY
jgi:hypothetical protein